MSMEGPQKRTNSIKNWIAAAIGITAASATTAEAQQTIPLEPVSTNTSTLESGSPLTPLSDVVALGADQTSFVDVNPEAPFGQPFDVAPDFSAVPGAEPIVAREPHGVRRGIVGAAQNMATEAAGDNSITFPVTEGGNVRVGAGKVGRHNVGPTIVIRR